MAGPVHYEFYVRKTAPSPWSLVMATEDRNQAMTSAEEALADGRAVAVRVTKETLDPATMEFNSITVLNKGAPEQARKRLTRDDDGHQSNCMAPQDLYTPHARELIGRVLEDWLARQGATAFELLHRADLVERLEAAGVEMQHAVQKVAVPESQATGQPVHELIRHYQGLLEKASARVRAADRRGFPDLAGEGVAAAARRLGNDGDRSFLMGGAVVHSIAGVRGARARLDALMDIADQSPPDGSAHALVMVVIEQLLCEMLAARGGMGEVLGPSLDLGGVLAALVRMAAPAEVDRLIEVHPRWLVLTPPIDGPARRLGQRLEKGEFPILAAALARRVARELTGPRRLRPSDAPGEIEILRLLAMTLTATAGRLLSLDEVQTAFVERSKSLVTADFVATYVSNCASAVEEAQQLIWLCENVTGTANKRAAARWLAACVSALRFETELRAASLTPAQKLMLLATLQRTATATGLGERDTEEIGRKLGELGGLIEAEAKLTTQLSRAPAPPIQKLGALLKLAAGEAAPIGPAADRAKAEAIRLLREPDARAALASAPEALMPLKPLMQAAGLAA